MVRRYQPVVVPDQDLHDIDPDQRGEHHLGQTQKSECWDQGPHPPGLESRERRAEDGQAERHTAAAEHQSDLEDEAQGRELVRGGGGCGRRDEEAAQWGQCHEQAQE